MNELRAIPGVNRVLYREIYKGYKWVYLVYVRKPVSGERIDQCLKYIREELDMFGEVGYETAKHVVLVVTL